MNSRNRLLIAALVVVLVAAGVVLANDNLELPRWVLGGGATDAAGGNVALRATLGQPIVGVVSYEEITIGQGFWLGGAGGYAVYLPLLLR